MYDKLKRDLPLLPEKCSVLLWALAMLFLLDVRELLLQSLASSSFAAVGIQIRYVVLA